MRRLLKPFAIVVGCWSCVIAQAPNDTFLQLLYEQHRWFELRDAIVGKSVPPLYSGAVASAFNRPDDAVRYLTRAARDAATVEAASDAREALVNLYMRLGRSSDMIRILDEAVAAAPSRSDFRNGQQAFAPFRRLPDQTARRGRGRPFRCLVSANGVFLPVVVNGKAVEWLFDSAFSHSALSDSEARMLGISMRGATATAEDFAGGTTSMRTAIAGRLAIGDAELRNVPVLVFPDSQPPWNEREPGKRGTIGLPVTLALRAIRWTSDGTCQVGANPTGSAKGDVNLAFDGVTPLIRAQVSGKPIEMVLDTGNQGGTQLWERFARDFPEIVSQGQKSTKRVTQIGGSTEREIVMLPQIRLRFGGFDGVLQPANVFSKPVGNDLQHGNLGVDVLSQAAEVTIDFQSMSLTVR